MNAEEGNDTWDFSPVYDLLQQFSITAEHAVRRRDFPVTGGEASGDSSSSFDQLETPKGEAPDTGLGNFDKIWEFMGQSPQEAPSTVKEDIYDSPSLFGSGTKEPKIVKWRDEIDGADLADNDDTGELLDLSNLNDKQRKKVIRHLRKAPGKRVLRCTAVGNATSSENDSEKGDGNKRTLNSKWVIHRMLHGSNPATTPQTGRKKMSEIREVQTSSEALQVAKLEALRVADVNSSKKDVSKSSEATPTAFTVAAARKETLMRLLYERFPDERQFLNSMSVFPHPNETTGPTPEGLHVFIDASNILIGFSDSVRSRHFIHKEARIGRQNLSFHSLSLLLTRGRPTSKLVLVGSDNFPAIAEAKTLGYETNILDRVHKAKELTDRQKYFSQRKSPGRGGEFSTGSGSETGTGAATHAHKKWVEQAVDEILHLKMMESIVDCPEPGTMILASGDAAEAEYSGGFLKMVERSLAKGWKVEVACFRANASGMYRKKDFREKWGEKFKLVELDDFVKVLAAPE